MKMIKKITLGAFALGLLTTSCSSDDDAAVTAPTVSTTSPLTVNLSGLEALGDDFVYEGWIIVDGSPVSTGRFTSVAFPQTYQVNSVQLDAATKFVLTIEPTLDLDPTPSTTKILAGDFSGTTANVWVAPVTTDANDFMSSWGRFFLRTPTDETGANNSNDESGIWFGTPGTMPPTAGLSLPTLAPGWKYEGWVIGESGPLSTGTFTVFDTADDNAGAATSFSGTENTGPPIPGEDFFNNAPTGESFPLDVRNRNVVITIEPVPDNSPAPFSMKPLTGVAGTDTAPTTHDLSLNLGSLPTGSVSR